MWTCRSCENSYDQTTGDTDERICFECMDTLDEEDFE